MEQQHQLIVTRKITSCKWLAGSHKPGDVVWVGTEGAQFLIDHKLCRWPESNPVWTPGSPMRHSQGWPIDRFAAVQPEWAGRTVVCIASGPSVTQPMLAAVEAARARDAVRVIAVNDMYLVAPWADIVYFADGQWWQWHDAGLPKSWAWASFTAEQVQERFRTFAGQKVSIFNTGMGVHDTSVFIMQVADGRVGVSTHPRELCTGGNSGYQAFNLAILAGAHRILLLGYDMRFDGGKGGKAHSHNGHPRKAAEGSYLNWARKFETTVPYCNKAGIEVINCSARSAITAFRKAPLEEALCAPTS